MEDDKYIDTVTKTRINKTYFKPYDMETGADTSRTENMVGTA